MENLKVAFNNEMRELDCFVLEGSGPALVGKQWLKAFGFWPLAFTNSDVEQSKLNKLNLINIRELITNEFDALFGISPGLFNKGKLTIHLKDNAKPVALKARHVPYALREPVEAEIKRLEKLGHLVPVDVSEWATPIVPVIKSNKKIRICGDYKLTINQHLIPNKNIIPRIDDIFAALQNGKKFTELDLTHAYMQILVDEKSQNFLTLITHLGLYKCTRMQEGVSLGPSDFQEKIESCIRGIPGTVAYLGNVYVTGTSDREHLANLRLVCKRLEDSGLRVNKNKCKFMQTKIEIIGFVIDKDGLHKSKSKVAAMVEAPRPQNVKELESFLGLITFYARFLDRRAELLKPLYDCAKSAKFTWTTDCENAFLWVKKS